MNAQGNASNTARQQSSARAEVTWDSLNAKIAAVEAKGITGDYGDYDTPIIMGDLEKAKARMDGDYWKKMASELQEKVQNLPKDGHNVPYLQRNRNGSVRSEYREALSIWKQIKSSDLYKQGRKSITRLKKAGFTQKEIDFYASGY